MAKATFTHAAGSIYDDVPESRYHFPKTYFNAVSQTINDWIVYYEPRRVAAGSEIAVGRQAYFAVARVQNVRADSARDAHFYADIGDFIPFPRHVPFRLETEYFETNLRREDGKTNRGAFGRAVRPISESEFDHICIEGFRGVREDLGADDWIGLESLGGASGFSEEPAIFQRPIIERIISRRFRDAAFARLVKSAYDETCALTGLKIINGGGKPEVEAAHI